MNNRLTLSCLALWAIAAGCANPCADLSETAVIELGGAPTDGLSFEPLGDGSPRPLVGGTQGGMHVWLHLRARGLCAATTEVERSIVASGGEQVSFDRSVPRFVGAPTLDAEDRIELDEPFAMVLCPTTLDRHLVGEPLRFEVTARDDLGNRATAAADFTVLCDEPFGCPLCGP